jgi:hypothetical protein
MENNSMTQDQLSRIPTLSLAPNVVVKAVRVLKNQLFNLIIKEIPIDK